MQSACPAVQGLSNLVPLSEASGLVRVHRTPSTSTDPRLVMLNPSDSLAPASFRILRHRLAAQHKEARTILVTSPVTGEGKTFCAVNLALALGEGGQARVLLFEANFRSPSLARLLGFDPSVCLGEQLESHRAQPSQPWVVAETTVPWLHTAAVAPASEVRPVLNATMELFIAEFRSAGYDYIVIDGPAVLGTADVNLLEESIDGIVMTAWAGHSRAGAITRAIEQIGKSKLLGFALLAT
jgi:Mrp family chromosome partitioning ATPase